ncbi:methyl-accepting chemotaxis protein [Halioxenophilus sp. WMMB6]|uniref:methyl-accepting chemotaxis protein n=1 Tax=Halioxenophilus sp. WMMB6 TaxID=3073815 RepID=UPI00295E928F|nr:methyl-accepting chemotaxis protein [Halioxenophilus sp. WMMB6]
MATDENSQVQDNSTVYHSALDNMLTAVMMVDRDFKVTYVNKATLKLLKTHEHKFQQVWSDFEANERFLLGRCIDTFHKNPSHQRALLANPANLPFNTDIRVADLIIELQVTAIVDRNGATQGFTLEWYDVTENRNREIEVNRLSNAVHGMTTNLMMADKDGCIVYINPALRKMLARREHEIKRILPAFNMDTLVGSNIDIFHKNPSHQRRILADPSNYPIRTEIAVADLKFDLTALLLTDSRGNSIGTAVQWIDITDERSAQNQIENLIQAATNGELSHRIDVSTYEGFTRALGEGINGLMDAIVRPISETITVVQALSEGDLNQTMADTYQGQFAQLAEAMNHSITNLSSMVTEIRSAATNVFSAAREIAQGNDDLSQRTETQASSLEETASAMEELSSTVQQNAKSASEATAKANDAMEKARNGGEVVKNAVASMEEINRSSKKIADIIGVIDEIAFQTNLLALNAAVEAARAGEQGRGFAVVAAEVRNLAQRSATAAKEIKGLINDSVDAVGKGAKLVDDTGETFNDLVSAVSEVVTMVSDIDSAGREQSAGISEVTKAVSQMDEMTQQNAALVEEASASSRAMEDQAKSLLDQVGFFQVEDQPAEVASFRAAAKRRPPAPAARRPARAAMPVDDEWEEF